MNVLVTGATGFVGQSLVNKLHSDNHQVLTIVRKPSNHFINEVVINDLAMEDDFSNVLKHQEVVIHLAARVHQMYDDPKKSLQAYRLLNRDVTLKLAHQAAQAGVKRFVFLSSIKVNGEFTQPGHRFAENDKYIPSDPYGLSKYEAEQGLLKIAKETTMEVVIVRPPLVYGPGVKANFAAMIKWLKKGIPLPFGAIHNQRSLVALDNLVDFIVLCANREKSPNAANEVFLISDGEDVSTTELLHKVAKVLNKKSWLVPVSVPLMTFFAKLFGKEAVASRLFGSLQVDISKARGLLGWKPVTSMDEELQRTVKVFLEEKN